MPSLPSGVSPRPSLAGLLTPGQVLTPQPGIATSPDGLPPLGEITPVLGGLPSLPVPITSGTLTPSPAGLIPATVAPATAVLPPLATVTTGLGGLPIGVPTTPVLPPIGLPTGTITPALGNLPTLGSGQLVSDTITPTPGALSIPDTLAPTLSLSPSGQSVPVIITPDLSGVSPTLGGAVPIPSSVNTPQPAPDNEPQPSCKCDFTNIY